GVGSRCWIAWGQWLLGVPDRALRSVEEAVALAERLGHPFTLDFAHLSAATVRLSRGEAAAARVHLERADAISTAEGFAYQHAIWAALKGWSLVLSGRPDEAIVRFREALAGYRATGAGVARPGVLALLAYATAMTGRLDEGFALVTEGLDEAERTSQQLHVVPLHVTRGDLLMWRGDPSGQAAEAEACYRHALELARGFEAHMLEVRPAVG